MCRCTMSPSDAIAASSDLAPKEWRLSEFGTGAIRTPPGRSRLGESLPMIGRLPGDSEAERTERCAHQAQRSVRDSAVRVSDSIAADILRDWRVGRQAENTARHAGGLPATPYPQRSAKVHIPDIETETERRHEINVRIADRAILRRMSGNEAAAFSGIMNEGGHATVVSDKAKNSAHRQAAC